MSNERKTICVFSITGTPKAISDAFCAAAEGSNCDVCRDCNNLVGKTFIPVFLTPGIEYLQHAGFRIPREFVVETLVQYDERRRANRCEVFELSIGERINAIQETMGGVSLDDLQDWCIGALRQRFFLDENVHGVGQLDLNAMTINGASACDMLYDRIQDNKEVYVFLNSLFNDKCDDIRLAVSEWKKDGGKPDSRNATKVHDILSENLPFFSGTAVKYLFPSGKLSALVIDDDINAVKVLRETPIDNCEGKPTLEQFIDFEDIKEAASFSDIDWSVTNFIEQLKKIGDPSSCASPMWNLKYNLILLDLCLGDQRGADIIGYHLLPILRQFFPHIPIIIHSQFEDMGHIISALKLGANWFLPRKQAGKLLRHTWRFFSNPDWEREWKTLGEYVKVELSPELTGHDFNESFLWSAEDRERKKYLIASIMRDLPGNNVRIESLYSGLGGAMTLRVRKDDRQTPLIVKLDTSYSMFLERERYLRFIRPYIDNCSGRIYKQAVMSDQFYAAIAYTFAGVEETGNGSGAKTVTLYDKLKDNLKKTISSSGNSVCDYSEMVSKIFAPVKKLHDVVIEDSSRHSFQNDDWPNAALDEYSDPLSVFSMRMPPMRTIRIDSPPDAGNNTVNMVVYRSFREGESSWGRNEKGARITGFEFPEGKTYPTTVELKGKWIDFITRYRQISPQMLLKIPARETGDQKTDGISAGNVSEWDKFCKSESPFLSIIKTALGVGDGKDVSGNQIEAVRDDLFKKASPLLNKCPTGIIHGDLNCRNIMIDGSDNIWLIDFARTRRGPVIFDYSVFFTSILSLLMDEELVKDEKYYELITKKETWETLIDHTLFGVSDPSGNRSLPCTCLEFIEKILLAVRRALMIEAAQARALLDVYPYAVALNLLCLTRILFSESRKNNNVSQAMLAGALIIYNKIVDNEKNNNRGQS